MEITIERKQVNNKFNFPCVMESSDGAIVLFHAMKKGILLNDWWNKKHGWYNEDWLMGEFSEFTGKIILEND